MTKARINENPTLRSLLYDASNSQAFGSLDWHEKMLADAVRVDNYYKGIRRLIKPGDVVIDLGTGSGILAFFASRAGAKKVYAIDHSQFLEVAKDAGSHLGMANVEFVNKNSRDFSLDEKADVIIHEQMGAELFSENMIENLLDLKKRALKSTGRIVPARFELFVEPVCLKDSHKIPYIWENTLPGNISFDFMQYSAVANRHKASDYQCPRITDQGSFAYFLTDHSPILSFDLNDITSSTDIPMTYRATRTTLRAGILDGFCVYFRVIFDDDIYFDTSPTSPKTNWANRIFRVKQQHYAAGEAIAFSLTMRQLIYTESWSVTLT